MAIKNQQLLYRYEDDNLVGSPIGEFPSDDDALHKAGFSAVAIFNAIEGVIEHELFRKDDEFVMLVSLDTHSYEVFYADNVPNYLRLVREVVNPLLVKYQHVGE